ncbi:hypothetical protein WME79_03695 [Sorangium sp. So ce726]|uniref:hypothetical protein n=1 Tax=Sorangium sp. So ce726 TaxID=3133319 RepID=UPI003F5EC487
MSARAQTNLRRALPVVLALLCGACSKELGDGPWAGAAGGPTHPTGSTRAGAALQPPSAEPAAVQRVQQLSRLP